jgi:hypothetical protein
MLTTSEAQLLEKDIFSHNKKVMREILTLGEMVLPEEKYSRFRQSILNSFGKSGLETEIKNTLNKYIDKKAGE